MIICFLSNSKKTWVRLYCSQSVQWFFYFTFPVKKNCVSSLLNTVEFYICWIFSGRTTSPQNYYEDKNLEYKILLATKMLCICAVFCLCEARNFEVGTLKPSKGYQKTSIEEKNGYVPVPFLFTMNIEVLSNNKDGDLTFSIPVKLFYLDNLPISDQIYHQWNYTFPSLFL